MRGYHRSIKISFMLVGHTKFSPDSCFGLLKKRFRVTKVSCLDDLVKVVNTSADVNEAQLVGSQSGQSIVSMYDWVGFFGSHVKKVPQITQQHHFHFSAEVPGTVVIQKFSDSDSTKHTLTSDIALADQFPEIIVPPGLSLQRQWYLHDKIREFCPDHTKDIVCPKPSSPQPIATPPPTSHSPPPPSSHPPRKGRVCGLCGQNGHNRRTCPSINHP